jgi:parallel beta-helix repeat protein
MRRILVVLALLGVWLPARAQAEAPVCGAVIEVDTTLAADVTGCPGDGLTLAPGVELDLGGHTVSGTGAGDGIGLPGGGQVRNGTVTGFSTGVRLRGGLVEDAVVAGNVVGVSVRSAGSVHRVDAHGNTGSGLGIVDSRSSEVLDSSFTGNGKGVTTWLGNRLRIEGNTFSGNRGAGLSIVESPLSVVQDNTASGNGADGISIDDPWSRGAYYTIASDVADGNAGLGISVIGLARFSIAPFDLDGGGNTASGNGDARQCVQVTCPGAPAPRLGPLPARVDLSPGHRYERIQVTNLGGGQLEYTATSDRDWLELHGLLWDDTARMAPSPLVAVVPGDLGRGEHRANVTVEPVAGGPAQHIKVAYTVLAPPALRLSASALPITLPARAVVPRIRTVNIRNAGDGELRWTARTNHSWVTVTPAGGTAPSALTVRIAPKGLSPGTHTATVRIHPLDHAAPDRTIAVTLRLV